MTLSSEIDAVVQGIEERAPGSIFTAHASRNHSALDSYNEPWLDVNSTYSDPVHGPSRLLLDAQRTSGENGPVMPTFWIEGYYENEHDMTDEMLRAQVYWSLLSGGSGHFYGAFPVWSFGASSAATFGDSEAARRRKWPEVLESRVASQLALARMLVDSFPVHHLEPLAQDGLWPSEGDPGAPAVAWAPSDSLLIAYVRGGRQLDLAPTRLRATREGIWFDPRTGQRRPVEATTLDAFAPPSNEDWVLILQGVVKG